MACIGHAFSITSTDVIMDLSPHVRQNKPLIKVIGLVVSLLIFGTLSIVIRSIMAYNHVGSDFAHWIFLAMLESLLFLPGFYHTKIAHYAYKGYKSFSFSNIPRI